MSKPKTIQIEYDLFLNLILYTAMYPDHSSLYDQITYGVAQKLRKMAQHDLFGTYKTAATEGERKKALTAYLDSLGIPEDYRWCPPLSLTNGKE